MDVHELIKRSIRIIHIARKPTSSEFWMTAKVTSLGMLLFGLIGFVVSVVFNLIG